jgi:superfamily II DNA or RNA helicase
MPPSLIQETPTRLRLVGFGAEDQARLKASLTYKDQKVFYEWRKFRHAAWYAHKFGQEAWQKRLDELKASIEKCLVFEDDSGLWTYSGLAVKIIRLFPGAEYVSRVTYPSEGTLGWNEIPPYQPHYYQTNSKDALILFKHAGVEIGTGLGKSLIIYLLLKHFGLKAVVMAPGLDIAKKFYEECLTYFGPRKVGFFGDGKKVSKKQITIAIGASLTRVEPGSEHWKELSKAQVFVADESHLCPAATLTKVCFGLMAETPYRFFFSATQLRNDGLDLLLEAITGPIVYRMTVKQGIDEGFLAQLRFMMIKIRSNDQFENSDVNEMTRHHLYYNDLVIKKAAWVINNFVSNQKKQVLVLVEEFEQFARLYPMLQHAVKFAHGGVSKENAHKLPKPFHKSDPSLFVKEFNAGEFPILVGTSCITTGTDVKANEVTVNLQGGKSEIAGDARPVWALNPAVRFSRWS